MATRAQLNISLSAEESAQLEQVAAAAGFTAVELARKAVKAVLEMCADGRIPTGNLRVVSPAYRIVNGRVVDASPVYPKIEDGAALRVAEEISEIEALADADDARRAQAAAAQRSPRLEAAGSPAPAGPRAKARANDALPPGSVGKMPRPTRVDSERGVL